MNDVIVLDPLNQPNVRLNKGYGTAYHAVNVSVQNSPSKSLFRRLNSFTEQQPGNMNWGGRGSWMTHGVKSRELLKAVSDNNVELCKNILVNVDVSQMDGHFYHPLLLSAQKGHSEIIRLLLQNGVDINLRNSKNSNALFVAIKQQHSKCALLLLNEGINFKDHRDCNGNYAIHLGAMEGEKLIKVVQWLLKNGQCANVVNEKGQTPLHLAAKNGHDVIIKLLLENAKTPDIWDAKDSHSRYPIHYAALNGHFECCRLLLRKNAMQAVAADNEGSTPLILAAMRGHGRCCTTVISYITKHKLNINIKDSKGNTALHHAATNGFLKTVEILLEANADCSIPNKNGNTPIHLAALQTSMECLKSLINNFGEYLSGTNNLQQGLLHIAAMYGCEQALSFLLNLNPFNDAIHELDYINRTPLHYASLHPNLDNVKILLDLGANHKKIDIDKNAPLHLAASKGLTDICEQFVKGRRVEMINVKNKNGDTPLHLATKNGSLDCCKLLILNGASITIENCYGFSPYHVAAEKGYFEILKFLTKKKLSFTMEVVEGSGDTPLHLVAKNGHFECCQYLLYHLKRSAILETNESYHSPLDEAYLENQDEVFALLLSNCPSPEQNCNNYEFESTLHNYMHEALDSKRETVQRAIVESDWWFSGFSSSFCKDGYCANVVRLIESNTELAKKIFGKCVEEINGEVVCDFRIFEQEFYASTESSSEPFLVVESPFDKETGKLILDECEAIFKTDENECKSPLQGCIENECRELIQHPLITEYWNYKWNAYLKLILYVLLLAEIMIVLILSLYMSHIWNWDQINATLVTRNEPITDFTCRDDLATKLEPSLTLLIVLRIILVAIVLIMGVLEILKFNFSSYLTVAAGTRVCRIICMFILILPLTMCSCELWITMSWQWLFGITALLASWFNMIHTLNLIPSFSVFMPITSKFARSFILVLLYIILILFIFSFIFYLLFNDRKAFANLGVAFVKSIVWILGDLSYDDMFLNETQSLLYPIFSNIIFVLYVTSIGGFIVNLIITQPADHYDSFRSDAAWYKASNRIQLLLKFDKTLKNYVKNYTVGFWVKNPKADIKTLIKYKLYGNHDGNITPKI